MPARYFDLIREMKQNTYNHRLRLVESAQERGIKPTARLFATTVPTVRKWLRRFEQNGPSGLIGLATVSPTKPRPTVKRSSSSSAKRFPPSAPAA